MKASQLIPPGNPLKPNSTHYSMLSVFNYKTSALQFEQTLSLFQCGCFVCFAQLPTIDVQTIYTQESYCYDFFCLDRLSHKVFLQALESSESLISVKCTIPDLHLLVLRTLLCYKLEYSMCIIIFQLSQSATSWCLSQNWSRDTSLMENCHVCIGSVQITGNIIHRVSQLNMNILFFSTNSLRILTSVDFNYIVQLNRMPLPLPSRYFTSYHVFIVWRFIV